MDLKRLLSSKKVYAWYPVMANGDVVVWTFTTEFFRGKPFALNAKKSCC